MDGCLWVGEAQLQRGALAFGTTRVSAWSRTESAIAHSSAEAELYSAAFAYTEAVWFHDFLSDIGYDMTSDLREGASAIVGSISRLGPGRLKHVEPGHLTIQEWRRRSIVVGTKVSSPCLGQTVRWAHVAYGYATPGCY